MIRTETLAEGVTVHLGDNAALVVPSGAAIVSDGKHLGFDCCEERWRPEW